MLLKEYPNLKCKKYFTEVLKVIKKDVKLDNYRIKVFLGGKNRGKSYACLHSTNGFFHQIRKGYPVVYMRNSLEEIKQMKNFFKEELHKIFPDDKLSVTDKGVYNETQEWECIRFVSSNGANNISGNPKGFKLIFYDEFNQELGKNKNRQVMRRLQELFNTIFRNTEQWDVWICGNTITQNNPIFNLFQIQIPIQESSLLLYSEDDFVLTVRYKDDLFTEINGDKEAYEMMRKINPIEFNKMIYGEWEAPCEAVVNRMQDILPYTTPTNFVIYDEAYYRLYQQNNMMFLAKITQQEAEPLQVITLYVADKNNPDIKGNKTMFYDNYSLLYTIVEKLANLECLVDDFFIYQDLLEIEVKNLPF